MFSSVDFIAERCRGRVGVYILEQISLQPFNMVLAVNQTVGAIITAKPFPQSPISKGFN